MTSINKRVRLTYELDVQAFDLAINVPLRTLRTEPSKLRSLSKARAHAVLQA